MRILPLVSSLYRHEPLSVRLNRLVAVSSSGLGHLLVKLLLVEPLL